MMMMFADESEIFPSSGDIIDGPHHSTPIKGSNLSHHRDESKASPLKHQAGSHSPTGYDVQHTIPGAERGRSHPQTNPAIWPYSSKSPYRKQSVRQNNVSDMENTTIQKQRQEIQLLVGELRDRDKELNEMVAAHRQQLLSWERDRQRLLILEQKCKRYHSELLQKKQQLDNALSQLNTIHADQESHDSVLSTTQNELKRVSHENNQQSHHLHDLEEHNRSLNDSLKAMSGTIGQLQAREQELVTLLRLKEKDVSEASNNRIELSTRVQQLDMRNKECQRREADALHRATQWKQKYTDSKKEMEQLTNELEKKDDAMAQHVTQLNGARQQLLAMQESLVVSYEQEKCKDELLESLKAKQERTQEELRNVRELYERQQRELTLIQLNVDSSRESSHQNSHADQSFPQDDLSGGQGTEHHYGVSVEKKLTSSPKNKWTSDSQKVSFEERLSDFLDMDENGDLVVNTSSFSKESSFHVEASPATKLQRLLTESRLMIQNLEKTTLPSGSNKEKQKEDKEGDTSLSHSSPRYRRKSINL